MFTFELSTVSFVSMGTHFRKWSLNYNSNVRFLAVENLQVKIAPFESDSFPRSSTVSSLLKVINCEFTLKSETIVETHLKTYLGNTIFYTFWFTNDYFLIFPSKVTEHWTSLRMISFKIISQRFGLSKIVIYVYFYRPIKKKIFHNT